jgi:hypothetical protein
MPRKLALFILLVAMTCGNALAQNIDDFVGNWRNNGPRVSALEFVTVVPHSLLPPVRVEPFGLCSGDLCSYGMHDGNSGPLSNQLVASFSSFHEERNFFGILQNIEFARRKLTLTMVNINRVNFQFRTDFVDRSGGSVRGCDARRLSTGRSIRA